MSGDEGVVYALAGLGKARDAAELPQRRKAVRAAGEYFMGIRLMSDVPNKIVVRGVEDIMKRNSQFYDSQT